MTTQAFPLESKQLAMELYAVLHELDPSRWKAEKVEALRARLDELRQRISVALSASAEQRDQRMEPLVSKLSAMATLLEACPGAGLPDAEQLKEAWMGFRAKAVPKYEELASSLKALDLRVPSLRPTNYMRNVFHVGIALFCIAVVEILPQLTGLGFWLVTIVAWGFALSGWTLEISRKKSARVNALCMAAFKHVAHPHEAHHVNSSTWYTTALALISLTHSPMLCAVALAILGVADPAAAVIGKRFGRTRLANGRSLEGTAAFIVVGALGAMAVIGLLHAELALWQGGVIALGASIAGGVTELNLRRVDDNLAIPVASCAAALVLAMLVGAPL